MARSLHWRSFAAVAFAAVTVPTRALAQAPPAPPPAAPQQPAEAPAEPEKTWPESPARAADPPLIPPPPSSSTPTSTSGTDVASTEGTEAAGTNQEERIRALEERVAADEEKLRRLDTRTTILKNLKLEAFIQPQLLVQTYNAAASPNRRGGELPAGITPNDITAKEDGTTTNGTFFRLRRTRLRTFYETDVMRLFLQIDVLPAGGIGPGIGTIVRNAEATGIARWTRAVRTEFTAGLFFTPFRAELLEASLVRPFIERTWFIQNAFPTERDIGAQAKTVALDDRLIFVLGVVNGQRLGERHFVQLPDLNRSKDLVSYLTYRIAFLTLGVNGYLGRGVVTEPENLRLKNFTRWAVNYQALAKYKVLRAVGETRLSAELAIAQNMDTGVNYPFAVPKIPQNISENVGNLDERALYVRFEQDIGSKFLAGYRYDFYSPDTAIKNNARDTHALLAVVKFSRNLRWMNELSWAIDNVHAPDTPPPSKHIVSFSSVLQAMF